MTIGSFPACKTAHLSSEAFHSGLCLFKPVSGREGGFDPRSARGSLPFRLPSWSRTGNHRITWKILHRGCAIKECIFLQLVGAVLSTIVVWTGKIFYPAIWFVCLGVKSADTHELAQIASQPSTDFTAFVGEFKILETLLPIVNRRVCSKAGGVYASDGMFKKGHSYVLCCRGLSLNFAFWFPEAFSGPSNLQFSSHTSDSLSFRWSEAKGPVVSYSVQYVPLSGLGQAISAELRQVRARTCCGVRTNSC